MAEEKTKESTSKKKTSGIRTSGVTLNRTPKEKAEAHGLNPDGIDDRPLNTAELQKAQDEVDEAGFVGIVPDPTPNENYQASNSAKENDLPTPETDDDLYEEARRSAIGRPREAVERSSVEIAAGAKPRAGDE